MASKITVTINTRNGSLLWSDFNSAIQNNILAASDVGANLTYKMKLSSTWRVENISMNSPVLVDLEAPEIDGLPDDWTQTFVDGMQSLERSEEIPPGFSKTTINHIAKLVNLKNIESIEYKVPGRPAVITTLKAAAHAFAIKDKMPLYYYSNGELKGELGQITVHGTKTEFAIYDQLTDRRIPCKFSAEEIDEITELLTKMIVVSGRIKYDNSDRPLFVDVESWYEMKKQEELASLDEIRESMEPLPDGMSSEEFIRSLRDDDD